MVGSSKIVVNLVMPKLLVSFGLLVDRSFFFLLFHFFPLHVLYKDVFLYLKCKT